MKDRGPEATPPPESDFHGGTQRREVRARSRTPLEEHPFGLRQFEDAVEVILDGVDEAGGALRMAVGLGLLLNRRPWPGPSTSRYRQNCGDTCATDRN